MVKKNNILSKALGKLKQMQKQLSEESQVLDELKDKEDADEVEIETLKTELSAKADSVSSLSEELKKRNLEKEKLEAALGSSSAEFKALREKYDALEGDYQGRLLKLDELSTFNQRLTRSLREKEEVFKNEVAAAKSEAADEEAAVVTLREELKKQKEENGNLSHKLLAKAAEFKAALDKERAEFMLNFEKMEESAADGEKALKGEAEALRESLRQKAAEAARSDAETKTLLNKYAELKDNDEGRLLQALKGKEEIYANEVAAARSEAAGKEALAASLREELKKQKEENVNLSHELLGRAAEFKAALDKERADLRLTLEKMECSAAEAEKGLMGEVEALRESLRQKAAEASRSGAEIQALLDKNVARKEDYEGRLLRALKEKEDIYKNEIETARSEAAGKEALAASLREELKKQKEENLALSHELLGKAAELKAALDKERVEFRLTLEKMEFGVAEAEKGLLNEVEALRDTLRQKAAELAQSGYQIQTLLNKHDALKADYEARLLKLDGLNASVREEVNKEKIEIELLSLELRSKAAEFRARLDSERTEAKTEHKKAQEEIRDLSENIKRLQREVDETGLEVEKIRDENAVIKAQRDSGLVKLTEQEIYSKSAASALMENREELEVLKGTIKSITEEMAKNKEDFRRRLELLRLELDEKNRQIAHLDRELEKSRGEKENLKAEMAAREKEFHAQLEKERKEFRLSQAKNTGGKNI
ncbi:MAG: hypothetical protein Q7R35_16415 [Elusimicrobiota bacterium]|nr:hypothetical protein [Elusimicrobiota bacterium]